MHSKQYGRLLANIYWEGALLSEIRVNLFTQSHVMQNSMYGVNCTVHNLTTTYRSNKCITESEKIMLL